MSKLKKTVVTNREYTRSGAAIYSKVSSSRQRQSSELARQEELVKEHCKGKGYRVSGVYSDVDSGFNDNRKGLLKLYLI